MQCAPDNYECFQSISTPPYRRLSTVNLPKRRSGLENFCTLFSSEDLTKNQNRVRNPNPASEKVAEQCVSKKSAHSARALLAVSRAGSLYLPYIMHAWDPECERAIKISMHECRIEPETVLKLAEIGLRSTIYMHKALWNGSKIPPESLGKIFWNFFLKIFLW